MRRKCSRTIDRPVLIFGLELEDIAVLALVVGAGGLLVGPALPGVLAAAGWIGLAVFKRGKPPGYLLHWLYVQGFDLPGLIAPLKRIDRYCVCTGPLKNSDRRF